MAHATPGRPFGATQPPGCPACHDGAVCLAPRPATQKYWCTDYARQAGANPVPRTNSDPRSSSGLVAASPRPKMLEQQSLLQ